MYSKEFKELVEKSAENGQYVGLGKQMPKYFLLGKKLGLIRM